MVFSSVDFSTVPKLESLRISNVVLHGRGKGQRSPFARCVFKKAATKKITVPTDPVCPFLHSRQKTKELGTYLSFLTSNCIRAGPSASHSAAYLSILKYRKLQGLAMNWAAIGNPNVVITGQFSDKIDFEALKRLPSASSSSKFPGVAISSPFSCGACVEIYQSSRFIVAGVRSPALLKKLLLWLVGEVPWAGPALSSSAGPPVVADGPPDPSIE